MFFAPQRQPSMFQMPGDPQMSPFGSPLGNQGGASGPQGQLPQMQPPQMPQQPMPGQMPPPQGQMPGGPSPDTAAPQQPANGLAQLINSAMANQRVNGTAPGQAPGSMDMSAMIQAMRGM
jgi:hypothetical protein